MGARKLKPQSAEISGHPATDLFHALSAYIKAEIAAGLNRERQGAGAPPTFAEYRARAGHTIAELALLSGVSKSTLGELERCEIHHPDFEILNRIAAAVGVEPSIFRAAIVAQIERKRSRVSEAAQ